MKRIVVVMALFSIFLWSSNRVLATPIGGHYTVTSNVSGPVGGFYTYGYEVYNVNQGELGLDGFVIQVPLTATLQNITNPATLPTGSGSWWHTSVSGPLPSPPYNYQTPQSGYQWLVWGIAGDAEYPIGTTATFSFEANAPPGINLGLASTGPIKRDWFEGNFTGPTSPVPVPSTVLLLGSGLLGLAGWRIRKR
jgi:hypothetical protein